MALGLKRLVESCGLQVASRRICEVAKKEKWGITETKDGEIISLREIFEAFCGDMQSFLSQRGGFIEHRHIQEADVKSSAFSNIIGVLLANEVIAGYEGTPRIGDQLVNIYKTNLQNERYAGFVAHDDVSEINEGESYPEVGMSDKYVTIPDRKKKGAKLLITEESILYDRTGQLQERARMLGERSAEEKEERILSGICGGHQCYFPSGVSTNLYAGTPQLVASNALVDWTDIEKAELDGLKAMVDEKSKKINVIGTILLVPSALYRTGKRIVNATEVWTNPSGSAISTVSANPITPGEFSVATSPHVSTYTGNSTSWFFGNPKKQFRWKEVYPLQVRPMPPNSYVEWDRDILFGYSVRQKGDIFAIDNKYFVKCNA